jgi:hypothetical protein
MFVKKKKNEVINEIISSRLDDVIEINEDNKKELMEEFIDNIILPIYKQFKENLEKRNIITEIDVGDTEIARHITFTVNQKIGDEYSEQYEFSIFYYLSDRDYGGEKVNKQMLISSEEKFKGNYTEYNIDELTQEVLMELLFNFIKICKFLK